MTASPILIEYTPWSPAAKTRVVIDSANAIIADFARQDIDLTLRALYYQLVSTYPLALDPGGEHPNTQQNYKRLVSIMTNARLAGMTSWTALVDRTRNLQSRGSWGTGREFLDDAPEWFHIDLWDNQPVRVEYWHEKDAGLGTVAGVCARNDVPYFSCRGNCSASEMWIAAQRIRGYLDAGQGFELFYGGDLDPKGWDMTRDVQERLSLFCDEDIMVRRLFLNLDQIELYDPTPNPVKDTDSSAKAFRKMMEGAGYDPETCWEVEALRPQVITQEIQDAIDGIRDEDLWNERLGRLTDMRANVRRNLNGLTDPTLDEEP